MLESGTELIDLVAGESYMPTKTSVDKRNARQLNTSLAYWQIGADAQQGFSYGPVFKMTFVDAVVAGATHVKIWGVQNDDDTAPIWPIAFFTNHPHVHVWLKKFEFLDGDGLELTAPSGYNVIGYKKRAYPMVW